MLRLILATMVALFFSFTIYAQSTIDWWYFGYGAGIHFTPNGPVTDTNSQMSSGEGTTVASSIAGKLLFYSEGISVWDSTHSVMPNGANLNGNLSSTQAAYAIPQPGTPGVYYLFTTSSCTGSNLPPTSYKFSYSIVDMSLNNGLGDVDTNYKNVVLFDSTAEKICAIPHSNGVDVWILGHEVGSNVFLTYLLSSSGLSNVTSTSIGNVHLNCVGYMKPNHASDQIVVLNGSTGIELFNFNNTSGEITSDQALSVPYTPNIQLYGAEFSPDDSKLYIGAGTGLHQFDLSAPVPQSTFNTIGSGAWAVNLGPDQKIYTARIAPYLGRINTPNNAASNVNYVDTAVALTVASGALGLPSVWKQGLAAEFSFEGQCAGEITQFNAVLSAVDSVSWDFGDPNSGTANTSSLQNPTHLFSDTGWYSVTLTAFGISSITVSDDLYIYPQPQAMLGMDTITCGDDSILLDVSQPHVSYLWNTGDTTGMIYSDSVENYSVTIYGFCDTLIDDIFVDESWESPMTISASVESGMVILTASPCDSYLWSTGDTNQSITVSAAGTYSVTCTDEVGCEGSAAYVVTSSMLVGVQSLHSTIHPNIYPNPVDDGLNIDWRGQSTMRLTISDTKGRVIDIRELSADRVGEFFYDTSDLERGLYLLRMAVQDSEHVLRILK